MANANNSQPSQMMWQVFIYPQQEDRIYCLITTDIEIYNEATDSALETGDSFTHGEFELLGYKYSHMTDEMKEVANRIFTTNDKFIWLEIGD